MHVKPRADYRVWDPDKKSWLAPEGREVPDADLYWHRLLADGDVERGDPEAPKLPIGSARKRAATESAPAGDAGKAEGDA